MYASCLASANVFHSDHSLDELIDYTDRISTSRWTVLFSIYFLLFYRDYGYRFFLFHYISPVNSPRALYVYILYMTAYNLSMGLRTPWPPLFRHSDKSCLGAFPGLNDGFAFPQRQYSLKPCLCHLMIVAGCTIIKEDFHPPQVFDSHTQKNRSRWRILGRRTDFFRTASCCRKARFSVMRAVRAENIPQKNNHTTFIVSNKILTPRFFWRRISDPRIIGHCPKSLFYKEDYFFGMDSLFNP